MSNAINLAQVNEDQVIQEPFPHFCIDNILDEDFANEVYDAFPSYQQAKEIGL